MWETFAAQFAGKAGSNLGANLVGNLPAALGAGGPVTSGLNTRDQSWTMGNAGWTVNVPQAIGPGATASGAPASSSSMLMIVAAGLAALWILKGR